MTLSDGSQIEIENGRFERKDPQGRTIEERPATAADRGLTRSMSQLAPRRDHGGGGVVAKLQVSGQNIEITYTDGWKEEIDSGRYELKDNLNRTVIERPARRSDFNRLFAAVQ